MSRCVPFSRFRRTAANEQAHSFVGTADAEFGEGQNEQKRDPTDR